jgi:hypothetical protein
MSAKLAAALAAASLYLLSSLAQAAPKEKPSALTAPVASPSGHLESYRDLISKAHNLTLQRDRLQATQVLVHGLQRETKNSFAYKELLQSLDELSGLFYTDKAQSLNSLADSLTETKPKEATEHYQEALRLEEGNLSILKSLARTQLQQGDCDHADGAVKLAEGIHPYSAEVKLLRLQVLDCQKNIEALGAALSAKDLDLEGVERFAKGLQAKELLRKKDLRKAKSLIAAWETAAPDYPEVWYWKWQLSLLQEPADHTSAVRYVQLCQNLSPRKKKSYNLDLELCKGREKAEAFLKSNGVEPSPSPTNEHGNEK